MSFLCNHLLCFFEARPLIGLEFAEWARLDDRQSSTSTS